MLRHDTISLHLLTFFTQFVINATHYFSLEIETRFRPVTHILITLAVKEILCLITIYPLVKPFRHRVVLNLVQIVIPHVT
ncbi:hypothetical protein D3C86_1697980 [compost metagenome]